MGGLNVGHGRSRSNAVSFPSKPPAMPSSVQSLAPTGSTTSAKPAPSLKERQALFRSERRSENIEALSLSHVQQEMDQLIDGASPQEMVSRSQALSLAGAEIGRATDPDDTEDWVMVDRLVDQVTTQDHEDGVLISTLLDDALSHSAAQIKGVHERLSLAEIALQQDLPASQQNAQGDVRVVTDRYKKLTQEFAYLEDGELNEGRMSAFQTVRSGVSHVQDDVKAGKDFARQNQRLQAALGAVWKPGGLSSEGLQHVHTSLEQAQQALTALGTTRFHSDTLTAQGEAALKALTQTADTLSEQHQRCEAFLNTQGGLSADIDNLADQLEDDEVEFTQQDLDQFKGEMRDKLTALRTGVKDPASALPGELHAEAEQQIKVLETRLESLSLKPRFLAHREEVTLKEKALERSWEDVGGSGVDISAKLSIQWGENHRYDRKNKVAIHTTTRGAEASVSASGSAGPVDVGGSLAIRGAKQRAFIQSVTPMMDPRAKVTPPTAEDLHRNPAQCLKNEGDTLIISQKVGLSAGLEAGAFGVKLGVEGSVDHEMRMSFQRAPGDPPAFYVRVEPENNSKAIDAHLNWGPFAVNAGGSETQQVFYEFQMSEAQVQNFLKSGSLPSLPDPKNYLLTYQDNGKPTLTQDTFSAFDLANTHGKLLRFGASREVEGHVSGSASVRGLGAQLEYQRSQQDKVTLDAHKGRQQHQEATMTRHKVVFLGETTKVSELNEQITTRREDDKLVRSYDGASVRFTLTESENSADKFQVQLQEVSTLLGRQPDALLGAVQQLDQTQIQLELKLDPAAIQDFAAQAKTWVEDPSALVAVAQKVGVNPTELLHMAESLSTATAVQHLDTDMSKDQQVLRAQGRVLGQFAKAQGLNGMAALERLAGREILALSSESDFYANKLAAIGAEGFRLEADDSQAKREFVELVGKQEALKALAIELQGVGTSVLSAEAKMGLLADVKAHQELLDDKLKVLLSSPTGREKALSSLLKSESGSTLSTHIRNAISDKTGLIGPRIQNLATTALQEQMKTVLQAYGDQASPEEALTVFQKVLQDQQPAFAEPLLDLLEQHTTSSAFAGIQEAVPAHASALVKQMDYAQQDRLLSLFQNTPAQLALQQAVTSQRETVLSGLTEKMGALKGNHVKTLEGYKQAVHDLEALKVLRADIQGSPHLAETERQTLLNQGTRKEADIERFLGAATQSADATQRADLFTALMTPKTFHYVGNASHALIDRLIQADAQNPQQLQHYFTQLSKAPKTEASRMMTVLTQLQKTDEPRFKASFNRLTPDQLKDMTALSQTQGLADTLRKYRDNISRDLSPLVVSELQALVPEIDVSGLVPALDKPLAKGLETAQEKLGEQAQEKLQEGLSKGLELAIDRLSGDSGAIRDRLFQMALDTGNTAQADHLRSLAPGQADLKKELAELERKFDKRTGELAQTGNDSATTRYKALLLEQRLKRFQVSLNLQQQSLPVLSTEYMKPLAEGAQGLREQLGSTFGVAKLSPEAARDVLSHLTKQKPSAEELPEVGALVRGLLQQVAPDVQKSLLTAESSVLTHYPKVTAPALLGTLTAMTPEQRTEALVAMPEKALKAFSQGLSVSERDTFMTQINAGTDTRLQAVAARFRQQEAGYVTLQGVLQNMQAKPLTAVNGLSGDTLKSAYERLSKHMGRLQDSHLQLQGLPAHVATPLQAMQTDVLAQREPLLSTEVIKTLSAPQRQALVEQIATAGVNTDFDKRVLTDLIENTSDLGQMQSYLLALQSQDKPTDAARVLQNKLRSHWVAALDNPRVTQTQRASALDALTEKEGYRKDNAQAVADILMSKHVSSESCAQLLLAERTQKAFVKRLDNKAELLQKMGADPQVFKTLNDSQQQRLQELCRLGHPGYASLETRLNAAYKALDKTESEYRSDSAFKRLVRAVPLRQDLQAAQQELEALPTAYRVPLTENLETRLAALDQLAGAELKPLMPDRLVQMNTFFTRGSDDKTKHLSLAALMVEKASSPQDIQQVGEALIAKNSKLFHAPIFAAIEKLAVRGGSSHTAAQALCDQWLVAPTFDKDAKEAFEKLLAAPESRAVLGSLRLPPAYAHQLARLSS